MPEDAGVHDPFPDREVLEAALAARPHPPVEGPGRPAAVMVCLEDEHVLLLRRALSPDDPWSGHVSFPGGRYDPGDRGLLGTALRETLEEVGFAPEDHGHVVGALGEYAGRGRGISSIRIAAFVAALDERPELQLSDEVADAHWVALDALVPDSAVIDTVRGPMPAFRVDVEGAPLVVWGITYGILEVLRAVR
jgi:8-oxo-dGTP pyrophosphatase MutT (NUDIX family)